MATNKAGRERDEVAIAGARLGRALAHSHRIRIIASLTRGDGSAKSISEEIGVSLETVAYHLSRVLFKKFGMVTPVSQRRRRGATETTFALKDAPAVRFLATAVAALEAEARGEQAPSAYETSFLPVDAQGARELHAVMNLWTKTVRTVKERCADLEDAALRRLIVSAALIDVTADVPDGGGGE